MDKIWGGGAYWDVCVWGVGGGAYWDVCVLGGGREGGAGTTLE